MSVAAVILDEWKLQVFKRRLNDAGYEYTEHEGIGMGTAVLKVQYKSQAELSVIIGLANKECAECKSQRLH